MRVFIPVLTINIFLIVWQIIRIIDLLPPPPTAEEFEDLYIVQVFSHEDSTIIFIGIFEFRI